MVRITASKVRQNFAETLKSVRGGERVMLRNHKRDVAAIVSVEDLELLQAIEDKLDLRAAHKALAEAKVEGTISWEDLKAKLGL